MVCSYQACLDVTGTIREDDELGRSPGWDLVQSERSRLCIYAFLERKLVDGRCDQQDDPNNKCDSTKYLRSVLSVRGHDEYARSPTK